MSQRLPAPGSGTRAETRMPLSRKFARQRSRTGCWNAGGGREAARRWWPRVPGASRGMGKLVESLGITRAVQIAGQRDGRADLLMRWKRSWTRPLGAGPCTFAAADGAEGPRSWVCVHALLAVGVNGDGHREYPGPAGHLRRGRRGVARVLPGPDRPRHRSPAGHLRRPTAAWLEAIGATLPGAAWQRCRTHCNCKEITRWFSVWGSMLRYGDLVGYRAASWR